MAGEVYLDTRRQESVFMTMLPCKNTCSRGAANRIRAKGIEKYSTFISQSINIGSLIDFRAVGPYRLHGMVVGKYEYNIRTSIFLRNERQCQQQKEKKLFHSHTIYDSIPKTCVQNLNSATSKYVRAARSHKVGQTEVLTYYEITPSSK